MPAVVVSRAGQVVAIIGAALHQTWTKGTNHVRYINGCAPNLDEAKVAAFSDRLVEMLSTGALTLMIGIGHRTGCST